MPKFVNFLAGPMNLGRFGWVEPGTPLVLTDQEYECVRDDKRYAVNKDPETPATSPEVARANAPANVVALEFKTRTRAQLLKIAEDLAKEGETVTLSKNPSREELLRVLAPFVLPPEETPATSPEVV